MPTALFATPTAPTPRPDLPRRVERLTREHVELWRRTADGLPDRGRRVGRWRQHGNERAARRLVDRLAAETARFPEKAGQQSAWRARVEASVRRFGEERLDWPQGYRDLLFADAFFESTRAFLCAARGFDRQLTEADLGQALRNVWIANSLQMLLGLPIESSPAIVAYSLIYPYTDNFLDDPQVPREQKRAFNGRLRRRLEGADVPAFHPRERQVFRLVGWIESQYPRDRHPEVFRSLLAIHRAQGRSLAQHTAAPAAGELLAISVEKGGTSVLADGYLAAGRLSDAEESFCFGYGVFLQLLDDLQDASGDRQAGHRTLFSASGGRAATDRTVARLLRFIPAVFERSGDLGGSQREAVEDLIRRNCLFLLVSAVARSPRLFGRRLRRRLQGSWPLRFAAMRRLERRVERHWSATAARLERERGASSPLDLLG